MSFVDKGNKLVFIHVPKTGGTSIRSAITAADYRILPLHQNTLDNFTTFGITRHPIERFLSGYNHLKEIVANDIVDDTPESLLIAISLIDMGDLNFFIKNLYLDPNLRNGKYSPSSFVPQWYWLGDEQGPIVDKIFEFNDREKIYSFLKSYYPKISPLPQKLKTRTDKKEQWKSLTGESKEMLYEIYDLDFKLFNYGK